MTHGTANDMRMFFGTDGKPFMTRKTSAPDYKNDYPFYMQPQSVRHVSIDILDLSKPEDYEYYLKIWRAVGLGSAQVVEEAKQWVDAIQNWKVFIRWFIKGKMDPAELRNEIARATRGLRSGGGPEMLIDEGDTNGAV